MDVSIQSLLQIALRHFIQLDWPLLPEDIEMFLCVGLAALAVSAAAALPGGGAVAAAAAARDGDTNVPW